MLNINLNLTKKDAKEIVRMVQDSLSSHPENERKVLRKLAEETQKALKAN